MKYHLGLIIGLIIIALLWNTILVYPIKLLIVFFHEFSHALATIATGGIVSDMVVEAAIGGYVVSIGGNRFLITSAGYLGSLLWGAAIYLIAVRTKFDNILMCFLGALLVLVALTYVSNGFGFTFSVTLGLFMILLGLKASNQINTIILRLIGLVSLFYVPIDIYDDTLFRSYLPSDARKLAEEFGGTTWFWGVLWLIISLLVVFKTLKWANPRS